MKKALLFLSPMILLLEILAISVITKFMREPNDNSVLLGVVFSCIFVAANYFLISRIIKLFKQK